MVPTSRIRLVNTAPMHATRPVVLYWMIAARRAAIELRLEQAASHARRLRKPLVVLEALRVDHPWASDRFHQFVAGRHARQPRRVRRTAGHHLPARTSKPGPAAGRGLLGGAGSARRAWSSPTTSRASSCPRMVEAAGRAAGRAARGGRQQRPAADARRLDRVPDGPRVPARPAEDAAAHLEGAPPVRCRSPSRSRLPAWRAARATSPPAGQTSFTWLDGGGALAAAADRPRRPPDRPGGRRRRGARARWRRSSIASSPAYGDERNVPDRDATSRLSPYLHWGHLGPHEVFERLMTPRRLAGRSAVEGHRIARRLVGRVAGGRRVPRRVHHVARARLQHDAGSGPTTPTSSSLPEWARRTLGSTRRRSARAPSTRSRSSSAAPRTIRCGTPPSASWCAKGRIHNYLRMLWGKKILAVDRRRRARPWR